MHQYLTRNFIIVSDSQSYYQVLLHKLNRNKIEYNPKSLELLFQVLENYEKTNIEEYNRITNKLRNYTEDYVIENSGIIYEILKLSVEERNNLMEIFNHYGYKSDLEIFNIIENIVNDFENIILDYIDDILSLDNYNPNKLRNIAIKLKNNENEDFIELILNKFIDLYPEFSESDNSILKILFANLKSKIGIKSYDYIISMVVKKENGLYNEFARYLGSRIEDKNAFKAKLQSQSVKKLH